jgi:hypothetical protein
MRMRKEGSATDSGCFLKKEEIQHLASPMLMEPQSERILQGMPLNSWTLHVLYRAGQAVHSPFGEQRPPGYLPDGSGVGEVKPLRYNTSLSTSLSQYPNVSWINASQMVPSDVAKDWSTHFYYC